MIAQLEAKTNQSFLHLALKVDAVVSGANGVAYLVAAPLLDDLFGTSSGFLRAVGALFLVYAIGVWLLSAQHRPNSTLVAAVIGGNALWATASVVFAIVEARPLTAVGIVWTLAQAVVVGGFAVAQAVGLRSRRSSVA
ncbi:hypothetical protein [Antrihabitans spumae]|uniref:Uncharacterized protein n=1 Tax=Antrihabitans spumae TaxID=3373370 RepID=A0ABW7KER8_9NOCA